MREGETKLKGGCKLIRRRQGVRENWNSQGKVSRLEWACSHEGCDGTTVMRIRGEEPDFT